MALIREIPSLEFKVQENPDHLRIAEAWDLLTRFCDPGGLLPDEEAQLAKDVEAWKKKVAKLPEHPKENDQ